MEKRFLFYSHDGLGLGHVRRNLAIAGALTEADPEASALLATSADEVHELGVPANVDVLKMPGLRKVANGRYASRRLPVPSEDVKAVRSALLQAAVESFRPTVLVADKHPLGVGGELKPALEALRASGGRAVLGLRDILDDPLQVVEEWMDRGIPARIVRHYDRVLVYGDPWVFDLVREYRMPPNLAAITAFCGYVFKPHELESTGGGILGPPNGPRAAKLVLATAGGGEDGFELLRTFMAASARASWKGVVVSGRQSSRAERQRLRGLAAEAGVAFRTFIPGLAAWFPAVDALVSMGGYNTLTEAVATGLPTVCVPRVAPRTEQLIRAEAFSRLGLLRTVPPECLSPGALRREVDKALESSRTALKARARRTLDLDGARRAAASLLELLSPSRRAATAVLGSRSR